MTRRSVADLFSDIERLSVPDRLRLAADLIEHDRCDIAAQLVRRTHEEFQLEALQRRMR